MKRHSYFLFHFVPFFRFKLALQQNDPLMKCYSCFLLHFAWPFFRFELAPQQNETLIKRYSYLLFNFAWLFFRFELALQQNDTLDVFVNDYLNLGEADSTFGSQADNHLKVWRHCVFVRLMITSQAKTVEEIVMPVSGEDKLIS